MTVKISSLSLQGQTFLETKRILKIIFIYVIFNLLSKRIKISMTLIDFNKNVEHNLSFCGFNVSIRFYLMVKNKHIIISLLSFVWNQKQNLIIIRFECKGNKISIRNDNFKIPNQYFYAASDKDDKKVF